MRSPFEFQLQQEAKRIANEMMKANHEAYGEIMDRFCSYPVNKVGLEICPQCWIAEGKESLLRQTANEPGMSCLACKRTFTAQKQPSAD
jgi:hypothetical protein